MNLYEFLQQLEEARIPWPKEKSQRLFEETVDRIALAVELDTSTLRSVNLDFKSTPIFGQCGCGTENGKFAQCININAILQYDGLEDVFINNVCHEFCHFILNCQMYEKGYIVIDDNGMHHEFPSKDIEEAYLANSGHGKLFLELAAEISQKLNLKYQITPTVDNICHMLVDETHSDYWTYKVYCDKCDTELKFYTEEFEDFFDDLVQLVDGDPLQAASFFLQIYKATFEGEENNLCKCNGCLKFASNDGYDLTGFKHKVEGLMSVLFLKAMFRM